MSLPRSAHEAAEAVARDAYGRLVSYLAVRTRDLAAAEDAVADALLAALETWPQLGVPDRPEAWLLTAARRRATDAARRSAVRTAAAPFLRAEAEATAADALDAAEAAAAAGTLPDERLALLFGCAHPAVEPSVRTPLVLQAVFGIEAARIASAFLVSPVAMAQRLVRAKRRLRDAGVPFRVPEPAQWPSRVGTVLDAAYAAYGLGWDETGDVGVRGLAGEALDLARLLTTVLPGEPEAWGLLSLGAFGESRRAARRGVDGAFVPLGEQDPATWEAALLTEGEWALAEASRIQAGVCGLPGRYQLEAAIQSAHAARAAREDVDWEAVALLYEGLVRVAPTVGALVGRAAALGRVRGAEAGLAALASIPDQAARVYQPYWATRAHLLATSGRAAEARSAFVRAAGLADDEAVRAHLLHRAGPP